MMGESTPPVVTDELQPDWYMARKGISLLLNNQIEQADNLFSSNLDNFHIKAGRCFYVFMNAVMSFEEDKLQQALVLLRDMEKECAGDIGWLKSVKSRVFGASSSENENYVTNLEREVILADTQVCTAILTLLQQEMSSYVRAGWMLRKAWRVYHHSYNQILQLHQRTFGCNPADIEPIFVGASCSSTSPSTSPATPSSGLDRWSIPASNVQPCSGLRTSLSMILSFTGLYTPSAATTHHTTAAVQHSTPFVEPSEVMRLMSAVSFGYGIFQLCVSLLPSSLLKVTNFLGFEGDRQTGIVSLMHSRLGKDMRAPLATLALLWYHTIVRPFFGLDSPNTNKSGVQMAKQLILESQQEFQHSALFLFFSGRVKRLESDINGALEAYQQAVHMSQQREIKLLCLHEVAWCHLICLNYDKAHNSFSRLQHESRWSVLFYAYLSAVCCGAHGRFDELTLIYHKMCHCVVETTKETQQLNLFISRRFSKLINHYNNQPYTDHFYYRLLVYELLYLWNALSSCSVDTLKLILSECKSSALDREPMVGLRCLIEASVLGYLDRKEASIKSYKSCLQHRKLNDSIDYHISAFALYELGTLLCNDNKIDEGKAALLKAQTQYKDYDFENRLNVRINAAFKHLQQST